MAFSYSGNPAASSKDEVRFLIGDTFLKPYSLQDAEIDYAIALYSPNPHVVGQNFFAAWVCCEGVIAKLKASFGYKSVGDLTLGANSDTLKMFEGVKATLERRANIQGVPASFGGLSYAEKQASQEDVDIPKTAAIIDGMSIFGVNSDDPPAEG